MGKLDLTTKHVTKQIRTLRKKIDLVTVTSKGYKEKDGSSYDLQLQRDIRKNMDLVTVKLYKLILNKLTNMIIINK